MNASPVHILIIDDEPDIREIVKDILEDEGHNCTLAGDGQQARDILEKQRPDLIFLDIWMPDVDGITLLRELKNKDPSLTIVMMSGHGTIETAVEATRLGALDFIEKPLSTAKLLHAVEDALAQQQSAPIATAVDAPIGKSPEIELLREHAQRVATHDMPILLRGENGVGKHHFAQYLHSISNYAQGQFLEVPPESFPVEAQKLMGLAKGNCLFINDLALLSTEAQTLLLYLLENNKLSEGQLICATELSLEAGINQGSFQEALYYQLNSISLLLPPLRDHCEDIPELVQYFVDKQTTEKQLPYRHFSVAAQNRLRNHPWPGNILELENLIQRLLLLGDNEEIDTPEIDDALEPLPETDVTHDFIDYGLPLRESREQFERNYLLHKLNETDGNVGRAAKLAGMERTHLYRKLRTLGISIDK